MAQMNMMNLPGMNLVDPRRGMASQLMQEGMDGSPVQHWTQGLSRMAKALLGSYMMNQQRGEDNKALDAYMRKEPDSYSSQPTYDNNQIDDFLTQASGGVSAKPSYGDEAQEYLNTVKAPLLPNPIEDRIMETDILNGQAPDISGIQYGDGKPLLRPDPNSIDGTGWDRLIDFSKIHQVNTASGITNPNPQAEIAELMQNNQTQALNPKMHPDDYSMQNLQGVQGPMARRLMMLLDANKRDRDYTTNLAGVARKQKLDDIENAQKYKTSERVAGQAFTGSENTLNRQNAIDRVKAKPLVPGRDIPLPNDVQAQKIDQNKAKAMIVKPMNPLEQERYVEKKRENQDYDSGLQKTITDTTYRIDLLDKLLKHDGLKGVVGLPSVAGALRLPATDEKAFRALQDQVKGMNFMEAFTSLKGGGQITETEGQKATEAMARLDDWQSEADYIDAVKELKGLLRTGLERARTKAGYSAPKRRAGDYPEPPSGFKVVN